MQTRRSVVSSNIGALQTVEKGHNQRILAQLSYAGLAAFLVFFEPPVASARCGGDMIEYMKINQLDDSLHAQLLRGPRAGSCEEFRRLMSLVKKQQADAENCGNFQWQQLWEERMRNLERRRKLYGC